MRRRRQRAWWFSYSIRCNHKMTATVLRHRFLGLARIERKLLAVADRANPIAGDSERDEKRLHGKGASFAKREVVLSRTALVAVSLDRNHPARIRLQDFGIGRGGLAPRLIQFGAVDSEKDRLQRRVAIQIVERAHPGGVVRESWLRRYGQILGDPRWTRIRRRRNGRRRGVRRRLLRCRHRCLPLGTRRGKRQRNQNDNGKAGFHVVHQISRESSVGPVWRLIVSGARDLPQAGAVAADREDLNETGSGRREGQMTSARRVHRTLVGALAECELCRCPCR